jgi:hypothetical protein
MGVCVYGVIRIFIVMLRIIYGYIAVEKRLKNGIMGSDNECFHYPFFIWED